MRHLGRIEAYESDWTDSAVRRFAVGLREVIEMTMLPGLLTVLRAEAPAA